MLSQTLRRLERDGLVERTVHPVIPPHVDYTLTALGEGIGRHIETLTDWIEVNLPKIMKAQQNKG
jgi:DNA-binding HxlR family transcriptional regulator